MAVKKSNLDFERELEKYFEKIFSSTSSEECHEAICNLVNFHLEHKRMFIRFYVKTFQSGNRFESFEVAERIRKEYEKLGFKAQNYRDIVNTQIFFLELSALKKAS